MKNAKLFWRLLGYFLMAALFLGLGGGTLRAQTYNLVTDASTLDDGDEVLIVSVVGSTYSAMSAFTEATTKMNPYRGRADISVVNQKINNPDIATAADQAKACVLTLKKNEDGQYAFYDAVNGKYVATRNDGSLATISTDEPYYFGIGMTGNEAEIYYTYTTQWGTSNYYVRYSTGSSPYGFKMYEEESKINQKAVYLYKKDVPKGPYIQAGETEVKYKIVPGASLEESLVFKAGNLEHDVMVAVKSADAERENAVIEVTQESINVADAASGFDLDLTTSADLEEGEYTDIITLTSGDIKVEITVKLVVRVADVYELVTKVSKLKDGDVVLIVGQDGGAYYAMDATVANDFGQTRREGVEVEVTGNAIVGPDIATKAEENPCEFTLVKDDDGNYAFQDKVNDKYINRGTGSMAMSASAFYFSVSIDEATGAATVSYTILSTYKMRFSWPEFKFLSTTTASNDIYLYRKRVPEDLICHPVTMPADGGVTATKNSVEIIWNASEDDPDNGYRVTVTGDGYNKSKTVTDGTHIEWDADLSSETTYTYKIVSLCGENFESDPVEGTFTTLAASAPILDIVTPANNAVFTGDVDFTFTTENFTLDETHLVRAEVKATKTTPEEQLAAPILKTVYTQASPVTISGLADGKYHVDLYMVEVTEKDGKKDTAVVGFNGDYVHRDIEVKHPAVYFSTQNLKITTFLGVEGSGKAKVTGWALPEESTITLASNNANVTVTPATLTQAQVMATGGAEITVTFNGNVSAAPAAITATCGTDITATLAVNAVAKDTLANLKAIYSRANNDTVMVKGKMVVTYKNNSSSSRIYVQDVDKENGASMLLYRATLGYSSIAEGDVLENVAGKVEIVNGRHRFIPIQTLKASEKNHAIYVDTMSLLEVRAKSATYQAQNALVCIKDVKFKETGTGYFSSSKNYTLLQGKDTLVFRTEFSDVDYIPLGNRDIPTYSLYVTVLVGYDNGARVTARSWADMVEAPCLVPTDFSEEVSSDEAKMEWEGPASSYSVRYATTEADLESAEVKGVSGRSYTATGLTPLTTYYYQVKSVCRASNQSDWSDAKSFTTAADTDPAVNMTSPVERPTFTDSVLVSFRVRNVTLKADDTSARIVFSDGHTVDNYTDTVYKRAMPSGNYSVQVILVKDGQPLTPGVQTSVRYFSVDLPDVAAPVFTPRAGRYKDSVEVTLSSATQEATIFYAKNGGEYVAYTAGEKIVIKETTTLKAYAAKERMDTSAEVPATYTIYSKLEPEGDLVFAENFNKSKTASTADISNFGKVTDMSGWTGANMFAEVGEIKGGTTSKAGKLVSREINLSYDNGKYYVAFFARAHDNNRDSTKIRLTAGDETVLVSDLDKKEMSEYVYLFNNGTANTRLTFEALAASYNRFYLDSICVYQKLPEVPMIIAPATLRMATVQGTPVTQTVVVRGKLLESDVTVTCPEGNFSVTPATLDKEAVMSEEGAEITVTFNGSVLSDDVEITLASGDLTKAIAVMATAEEVGSGDECEAPTQLNAVVADQSVTLTWNGDAEQYRVVVSLGEEEICNELVTEKTHTLSDLAAGTYAWKVASVCENGEEVADGEAFTVAEKPVVEECDAPTQLNAAVLENSVTLTWNGAADKYRVVVTLGEEEICNDLINGKTYTLGNLEVGTYAWKVASVCENGEGWANGEAFTIEEKKPEPPVANEAAEGLSFRIYPNPTAGVFYVETAESANMEIFTLGGVMVRNEMLKAGLNEVRLDRSGIYFVRLTSGAGAVVSRVIVR